MTERLLLVLATSITCLVSAQDYDAHTRNKVFRSALQPRWLENGDSFWYRVQIGEKQFEYVLVNAHTGDIKRQPTLAALGIAEPAPQRTSQSRIDIRPSARTGEETAITFINETDATVKLLWINPQGERKPFGELKPHSQRRQHTFESHVWLIQDSEGKPLATVEAGPLPETCLIDGKGKNEATPEARPRDGRSPNGQWRAFTKAEDVPRRQVTLVESTPQDSLHPKLKVFDYVKPGDPLPQPHWVIENKEGTKQSVPTDLHPTPFSPSGKWEATWAPDSSEFYFDYNQRGHQLYRILAVNPATATTRIVVEETATTFIDYTKKTWRHWLHDRSELLWMSERDGWCHLYLYDIPTGKPKHQITKGAWPVREVLHVDEQARQIWFLASGLRAGEDPYHLHLCRIHLDGSGFVQLTQADGNHDISFSPDRKHFIASWSRADHPPVHELRRSTDGSLITTLERADATALLASGWTMPERFVAKGRDDKTDIHGILIKPSHFDPAKKYPVVEDIYAGPHGAFAPKTFDRLTRMHEIAQSGFIVVKLDGMGTNHRGKAFHDVCWKNLKDAGFPDRIRWITEAASTRPWMDLSRVGIYGGSAGGQNAMRALLDHHNFYKVAVADCGCHDNRMDKIWWNEQWMGWPVDDSYVRSSNAEDAAKLQGHLLLIVGELDTNVDPASTTQVVAALQRAGKTFDYMPIIGAGHGAAETRYGSKLRLDFLVRHLKP